MQTVNVPSVGTLQFPDGMSRPDMAAAIRKNFPQIHNQDSGASSAALDPDFAALAPNASDPYAHFKDADPYAQFADYGAQPGPKTVGGLDPDFAALHPAMPAPAPPATAMDWAKSAGSAFVRPIAKAVAALPLMAMDAGVASRNLVGDAYNKAMGNPATPDYELPSTMFDRALDTYTQAPTGVGKVGEFVSTALIGGRGLPQPTAGFSTPAGFASTAASEGLTAAQQQALNSGRALGMQVTPGQGTVSRALQQLEAKLESQPWTSGPFNALRSQNQNVLNRQAALAIGEDAPAVDATVLGRANERLGSVFENARSPSRIVLSDSKATTQRLNQVDSDLEGLLPEGQTIRSNPLVQRLENLTQSGPVNGQQLGQLSSKLGKAAYKQMSSPNGDRDLGQGLYRVKDHIDDLLQGTLSPEEAATYAQARQQYRTLMQLTSRSGIVNPSSGNVSGTALASRLQQADRPGFLYGKNQSDLYNAARFAQAFKPTIGDSGTATRLGGGWMPILGSVLGGIGGHTVGAGLEGAGAGALAAPALLNLASRAYLSRPGGALIRGAMATPGLLSPMVRPALTGGLMAGYTQ